MKMVPGGRSGEVKIVLLMVVREVARVQAGGRNSRPEDQGVQESHQRPLIELLERLSGEEFESLSPTMILVPRVLIDEYSPTVW